MRLRVVVRLCCCVGADRRRLELVVGHSHIRVEGPTVEGGDNVLQQDALEFVALLEVEFSEARRHLLEQRVRRQQRFSAGELPDFLASTSAVREGDWKVAEAPADLQDRRVEITGPTDRKMIINALNSGARIFMADFEDSNSPTWENVVLGQRNLSEAIRRDISFDNPDGRQYRLRDDVATLVVRPRGWHLDEKHLLVDGRPCSASLFDFGLYLFRNARALREAGTGPYFYLPKLEGHEEARLWNDVFVRAQQLLGVPVGTIKATVLIETIVAAFEMDEILYELRDHIVGLNAGRWDYIFSIIKKFRDRPDMVLPDRGAVTMTVGFMRSYSELLVKTCHKRGAFAIGGMAAFIPSRKDEEVNRAALALVRQDKEREAADGFDGTWVAHPDLVPVALDVFDSVLGEAPNQLERARDDVHVIAGDLLDVQVADGAVTEAGLRNNISVGIRYLESWLRGVGAAGLYNLMEDVATAEISRSQVWQWIRHETHLTDGRLIDVQLVKALIDEELRTIHGGLQATGQTHGQHERAASLFSSLVLEAVYPEFLTIAAYQVLP
jgi:malate synthase